MKRYWSWLAGSSVLFVLYVWWMWISIRHVVGEPLVPWAIGFCAVALLALGLRHRKHRVGKVREALVGAAISHLAAVIVNVATQVYFRGGAFNRALEHSLGDALLIVAFWPLFALAWVPGLLSGLTAVVARGFDAKS